MNGIRRSWKGLLQVSKGVRLKFAAMNLKKLAVRHWRDDFLSHLYVILYLLRPKGYFHLRENTLIDREQDSNLADSTFMPPFYYSCQGRYERRLLYIAMMLCVSCEDHSAATTDHASIQWYMIFSTNSPQRRRSASTKFSRTV